MSNKFHNTKSAVSKATVAEKALHLPSILPSKPKDPRALDKHVTTQTVTPAPPAGDAPRRRRTPRGGTTGGGCGDVKDYVREYSKSLLLPPLENRPHSAVNVVMCDSSAFVNFTKDHGHHSNAQVKTKRNNGYPKINTTVRCSDKNNYTKSLSHLSNTKVQTNHNHHLLGNNRKGTLNVNIRFNPPFQRLRSASANDVDTDDDIIVPSPSPPPPSPPEERQRTLYLVMKECDSEPEFRVWPPEGGEDPRRMSIAHFLSDESDSEAEDDGVAFSVNINWDDLDLESSTTSPELN